MASEIGSIQPNPYLFKIENKGKQRARLAHEIGAGAKCIKCAEKCSGFQLHYWRKLCLNCRCSKDEHEITEEDDDIGRLVIGKLFDRPIRTLEEEEQYSYGANLELLNNDTGKKEEYVFDWIPPGVAKDLVTRYMQMLPQEKWPVTGSTAARNRRKQLEQQLPLYDMDENERCENMLPEEMENFQKHLDNLRSKVAGQASVIEVNVPDSRVPPQNPRSTQPSSKTAGHYADRESCLNNNARSPVIIRHAGPTVHKTNSIAYPMGILELEEMVNSVNLSPRIGRASNMHSRSEGNANLPIPIEGSLRNLKSPHSDILHSQKVPSHLPVSHALPLQKDLPTVSSNLRDQEPIYANLSDIRNDTDIGHMVNHSQEPSIVQKSIPSDSKVPNLYGQERPVDYITAVQAPYSHHKDILRGPEMMPSLDDINILLPQEGRVLDRKYQTNVTQPNFKCQHCQNVMEPGDVAVICEKAGPDKFWHPNCFVCTTCDELLADLIYFYKEGKVYCGRHYHVVSNIPRCHACDELIFSDTWTRADGFDWHIHHYCCFICDNPLAGNKYIPDGRGYPHCISCYMAFMAKMCETCEQRITPDQTRAGYNGYFYHALPGCFCCHNCQQSLLGVKFKMAKNWVFCSQACIMACEQDIAHNPNEAKKAE